MQVQGSCVRPNAEEVVAKVIDGEAILINLANGIYYSMDGVGAVIWSMIEVGESLETIVATLTTAYGISKQQANDDVDRLIAELLEQGLVTPAASAPPAGLQSDRLLPAEKQEYATPTLNIYTDMGDLLALDPPVPGFEDISWEK